MMVKIRSHCIDRSFCHHVAYQEYMLKVCDIQGVIKLI